MRAVMSCLMATGAGLITVVSLVVAVRSWHGDMNRTLFDFLMPAVFGFIFYRMVGAAFANVTGRLAPWSYEAVFKGRAKPPEA